MYLQCMFFPNHVGSIVAPQKGQAAKIARQKIEEIWRIWPLLANELEPYNGRPHANFGTDYVQLYFKNGSTLFVGGALNSDRGLRTHAVLVDEARDQDGDMISEVILPQMNVSRRMSTGLVNPYEKINTQVIYATSAGTKSSYAYLALLDAFETSIVAPQDAFCIGLDYRIPVMHGLIDAKYVQKLKLNSSYNDTTFAAEYLGQWMGGSDESWFQFDKLTKYRKIKNPERHAIFREGQKIFYLISVDIARIVGGDQSVACIFRVNEIKSRLYATLVNIMVLGRTDLTKTFEAQTTEIKKLIQLYQPREVIIDINGLGRAIADLMIKPSIDGDGTEYPAYGFFNNNDYQKIQPRDADRILYGMIANNSSNPKIHGNVYQRLNSGLVRFLISEQDARASLLSTQKGRKMSPEKRIMRLMPHELTTKLFDEMANLRLKKTGLDIQLERINSHFPKDKYSALAYGLWRIKELEEEIQKRERKMSQIQNRTLIFYN